MSPAPPLLTEQCEILGALLDPQADAPDRTSGLLAKRLNMSRGQVVSRLEELQARSPPLVRLVFDETSQLQVWMPTDAARQAFDDGCGG